MFRFAALVTFGLASSPLAQTVWTVSTFDATADFAQIQPAIDAASDGDTILIRLGVYTGFEIDGKSLNLVGDGGTVQVSDLNPSGAIVRVENLAANQSVALVGMQIVSGQAFNSVVGIELTNNTGEVWLQNLEVNLLHPFTLEIDTLHALVADNSSTVVALDSTFKGHRGSEGLVVTNSDVFAYASSFTGGPGGPEDAGPAVFDGGDGARILSGQLFAADSSFTGGEGFDAAPFICTPATGGGHGVAVNGGTYRDRSTSELGGGGGSGGFCGLPNGADGAGTSPAGGSLESYPEPSRFVTANTPVKEGQVSTQTYTGVPSELVFTTIGFSLDHGVFFTEFAGPLLLGNPKFFRFCGLTNASGIRTKSFTVQEIGIDGVTAYFHPSYFDLGTLEWRSGSPAAVTYLDSGF